MNGKTPLGFGILVAGLTLGILGDILLRASPWGINLLLWTIALILTLVVLVHQNHLTLTVGGRWLVLPALFMAGVVAWHDSPVLSAVSVLALPVSHVMIPTDGYKVYLA